MTAYFVTGIGTDVGKTIVSAAMVEALAAHYWKPIQTGAGVDSDHLKIAELTGYGDKIIPNQFSFVKPISPHAAAAAPDQIQVGDFKLPSYQGSLIVEGAGGIMVPLNHCQTMLDLMIHLALPVVVVSRHYLGSINHTLLTIEVLKRFHCHIKGIVYVGGSTPSTENVIERMSCVNVLGRIPWQEELTPKFIKDQAKVLSHVLG